jgi:lambda family phage portal protein
MTILSRLFGGAGDGPSAEAPVKIGGAGSRFVSGYMRGGRSVAMNRWNPSVREAQDDVAAAWEKAAARANDAIINSGWLSGAIEQCVANTVGTGLRLKAQPENETFGMTNAEAQKWARQVEQRFELWARRADECDVHGMRSFGQLQDAAFRGWIATGEILAEVVWRKRSWNHHGTKIRVMPAYRLSRKDDTLKGIRTGLYLDKDDRPIAAEIKTHVPSMGWQEKRVPLRDSAGRRVLGHFHDGPLGAYRGIGPLVAALQVIRQFDDLSDATLAGQILKTLYAAVIESDLPTEDALNGMLTAQEQAQLARNGEGAFGAYLEMIAGFYEAGGVDFGKNARIAHLLPGDKLELKQTDAPGDDYKAFADDLKREIARALGMTFESFTGEYQGASYNSNSYGTTEIFQVTTARREKIVAPFCQFSYEAWLEEQIERGDIPFPGGVEAFIANRAAASRALWLGSPKPLADVLKAAKAFEALERMGVMSQGQIANALGVDIEDVYAARQQEAEMRKNYGLREPVYMNASGGGPQGSEDEAKDNDEGNSDDA